MSLFDKLFGNNKKGAPSAKLSLIDYNLFFDYPVFDNTVLELLNLGELTLPTGNIIACDPLVGLYNTMPFTRCVTAGKYPVIASTAKTGESGDRYAVVKLELSKKKAIRWEMALTEHQDVSKLKEHDSYFGFPVDAGLGCFCDFETQGYFDQFEREFMKKNPGANIYDDFFAAEFKKNAVDQTDPQDIGDWLNFHLPNKPELNVIMFHSGYGDGIYASYWGIDSDGEICSLIIDFQVF